MTVIKQHKDSRAINGWECWWPFTFLYSMCLYSRVPNNHTSKWVIPLSCWAFKLILKPWNISFTTSNCPFLQATIGVFFIFYFIRKYYITNLTHQIFLVGPSSTHRSYGHTCFGRSNIRVCHILPHLGILQFDYAIWNCAKEVAIAHFGTQKEVPRDRSCFSHSKLGQKALERAIWLWSQYR